jgi:serine protease Do
MSAAIKLPVCFLVSITTAFAQPPAAARADALHDLSAQMEALSHRVSRAVVQIFSTGYVVNGEREPGSNAAIVTRQRATGSGVVMSADGYIVTNAHVVAGARSVRVRMAEESSGAEAVIKPSSNVLEARIVGVDRQTDLAVLKVERTGLSPLPLGNSDTLRQGQLVMAFGSPLGLENSVSMGVVSSVARQIKPDDAMMYIQTDAPINPGNSGGPLVDTDGRVMGINTFILSQSGGSEGLGFAIPSNIIESVYAQIRKEGHVHRSVIGLAGQTITPQLAAGLRLSQDWGACSFRTWRPMGPRTSRGCSPATSLSA